MTAISKEVYELIREAYRSGYDNGYGDGWSIGKKYSRESEKIHPVTAADRYMGWEYVLDTEQDSNTIVNE
jgi:hypothetical protein